MMLFELTMSVRYLQVIWFTRRKCEVKNQTGMVDFQN